MCLLVVLAGVDPAFPLVVAANRDEFFARPAVAMTVLGAGEGGRILGGRDERAGGTWLAVNEAGVVAGLTNRPTEGGPDAAKRSRGELPQLLAGHRTAALAVEAFLAAVEPREYNPCWMLVGDRSGLHYINVSADEGVTVEELPSGVHVLENRSLREPSAKADRVRALITPVLATAPARDGDPNDHGTLVDHLARLLRDHDRTAMEDARDGATGIAAEARVVCVHAEADDYGTRSAAIISVGADPSAPPAIHYTDGPPCRASWHDAADLWREADRASSTW